MFNCKKFFLFLSFLLIFPVFGNAVEYSTGVDKDYPRKLLWGDTHLHSNQSADAYTIGNSNLTPSDAFRFARGEEVISEKGVRAKLRVPLDFLMVSDHATFLGMFKRIENRDPEILKTPLGKRWRKYMDENDPNLFTEFVDGLDGRLEDTFSKEDYIPIWKEITENVDKFNQPGIFTALIGYEWTPAPTGDNLHRVVVFKDDAKLAQKIIPFSAIDSRKPEDLWNFLKEYNSSTGGEAISISHNSNISGGRMFPSENSYGEPIDSAYANMRNRWEPLVEATQVKGDSETHPALSPDDQFADYETWEGNIGRSQTKRLIRISTTGDCKDPLNYKCYKYKEKEKYRYKGSYVRSGLRRGLEIEKKIGVNPYKFGLIGSTDNHTALAASEEDNFFGKSTSVEPSADRISHPFIKSDLGEIPGYMLVASGYTGIWAHENTRTALFDAMERKETYATTGPRMTVRFFGGWDFDEKDVHSSNSVAIGYAKGVPMGGDLKQASAKAPNFMIQASMDPLSGSLDRVQVIKGWMDSKGETHERVYDVAVSGGRKIGKNGRCKQAVGNTVDLKTATWSNSIGDGQLSAVWTDPDFDAKESAFYYVRVMEIPTPRWVLYDKVRLGAEIPKEAKLVAQERAYTSPIWYSPK